MKFAKSFIPFAVFSALMFVACGDDTSSTNASVFPDEVADKTELNTYDCNMSVIGKKVFVTDLDKNYECDGGEWFESYDQSKSSAKGKSSSSSKDKSSSSNGKSLSSSGNSSSSSVLKQSSSSVKSSSSSVKSSSSRPTEILKPELKVNETCSEKGACDAMVKSDVSTWHFVRKDAFGDDAEYTYKAEGRALIVAIKNADGTTDSKSYSMYDMESEVGVEMAFNAAKSTCKDGGGNDRKVTSCVKDSVIALPNCDKESEGLLALKDSIYQICKSNSWTKATVLEYDTYGLECFDDGRLVNGKVNAEIKYVCASGKYRTATNEELDYGRACVEGNENALMEYADSALKKCQGQKWVDAPAFDYNTYKQECNAAKVGQVIKGRKTYGANDEFHYRYYCSAEGWVDITSWSWDVPNEARLNPDIDYQLMTDSRDGHKYRTVTIGEQTWMAENLNYADSVQTPSLKDGYSVCFRNDSAKCDVAGRFYLHEAVEKNEEYSLCPDGWRLPDTTEWRALINFVASVKPEGARGQFLCSQSGWHVIKADCSDDFGFSALPVAVQGISYKFDVKHGGIIGYDLVDFYTTCVSDCNEIVEGTYGYACFWAALSSDDENAYYMCIDADGVAKIEHQNKWKANARPIRCIKDKE